MEIYSPSAKGANKFRMNQPKQLLVSAKLSTLKPVSTPAKIKKQNKNGQTMRNNRVVATGSSVDYVIRDNANYEEDEQRKNPISAFFEFLKFKFVERMKAYFDYEDRYEEKKSNKTWKSNDGRNY